MEEELLLIDFDDLGEMLRENKREAQQKAEKLRLEAEEVKNNLLMWETMQHLQSVLQKAKNRIATLEAEAAERESKCEKMEANMLALKEENKQMKLKQDEMEKMTKQLAKQTDEEGIVKALRTYLGHSQSKRAKKKDLVRGVLQDFVFACNITLPDDVHTLLDNLDKAGPQGGKTVVNVEKGGVNIQQVNELKR